MKKDIRNSNIREDSIRPITKVQAWEYYQQDPNYVYRGSIDGDASNIKTFRGNIDECLDKEWEVVYDTEGVQKSKLNTTDDEQSRVPSPVTMKGEGGALFVLMRRPKDVDDKYRKAETASNEERERRSSGAKITKKGNQVTIEEPEINENNLDN